jgi:ABC-type branched-subunit amino acid transport system substrate-binding protein
LQKPPQARQFGNKKAREVAMVRPVLAVTMVLAALGSAQSQESPKETYKIGLVAPLTGPFTSTGKQVMAGAQFYSRTATPLRARGSS